MNCYKDMGGNRNFVQSQISKCVLAGILLGLLIASDVILSLYQLFSVEQLLRDSFYFAEMTARSDKLLSLANGRSFLNLGKL